jgi:uncharacterized repeat protein (TIGR01451 family)
MNAKRLTAYRVVTTLVLLVSALAELSSPPQRGGGRRGVLPPLRTAQAASGTWTQTEWTTPNAALGVAPSGTNQYFRPSSVSSFGQLVGTFGVCAGAGVWCQGPGDSAGGQTLRLAGNHKSDASNPYSSDLNGDGISELLFANWWNGSYVFNGGWIYWGQGTPTSPSWSASQRTDLPTIGGHGAAVADLNGDGRPEVIFSNFYNGSTYNLNSYIYWGQAGGPYGVQYSASARTDLPTSGGHGAVVADLNGDGRPEVIFTNYFNDSTHNVNSMIYWGQAGGPYGVQYSVGARTDLPTSGAHIAAVADLNGDGRPEVIFANCCNDSTYNLNSYIYWGQAGGTYGVQYSASARTDLPTSGARGVAVADLNGDGRPEVIFANSYNADSYIYWGQAGGTYGVQYSASQRTNLPGVGAHKTSVADVNNDGQRDVVIQNYNGGFTRVFWGPLPGSGTATSYWDRSQAFGFRGLSLSDLNGDGRVDLLTGQQGGSNSWFGGTSGRVYFHNGTGAPYNAAPSFDLPVQSSPSAYASFGPGRGSSASWSGQPRPVYGTAFPNYGALESMVMDSGQNGAAWHTVSATTQISAGTGITLFVAASDNLAALNNPTWVQAGAMGDGSWTQSLSGVSGRYARYRVILWRDHTTEASPALQDITFAYETIPTQANFNKTAPANGASGQPVNNLLLQWTTVADAGHYELCYDTTLNGACNASWLNVGSLSSFLLSGLTLGTTYEWQVRACNIAGCNGGANNGGWWLFTTATGPAAFSKLSPADNSSGLPPSPTLVWASTTGNGTVTYDYCVKTVNAACTGSEWTNVGTLTSVTLSGLSAGTIYYWQVRACDDDGCREANAGSRWKFQTAQAVGSFSKFAPGDGAFNVNTNTAQLQWSQSDGATEYKVCLGTAVNACNILDGGPGQYASVGANQFRALSDLPLQPNTTYYWQVLATNGVYTTFANGNNPFAFWSFTTLPNGPGNFNKTAPAFNATNVPTGNIAFNWTLASGAVSYTVCVGAFAGDCSTSATSFGTSVVLPGPLPAGATLVWQVTAHNAAGTNNADSNAWWPFTTVPNAPLSFSKYAPVNGASGQPVGVNLAWQDTPDETYYQVCVGTSPGLCTFANVTTTANTTSYALTGLDFGTTYHWQVSACNAGGCTPANGGAAWSFSTLNPPLPGPFYKSAPANGALNVPANAGAVLLQWTASAQANGYEVCMGTSAGSCNLTGGGFRDVSGTLSVTVQQIGVALAPASTYYWQVRAYNVQTATRALADGGVSFHFSTAPADGPAEFGKESPVNGTYGVATGTVALRWFSSAGATSYELCAGTAVNSCDALPGNGWLDVGNALSYTLSGLQAGTTYYWQVRAKNAGGATPADGGGWWRFNTINDNPPAEFSKLTPAHLAAGVPTATAVLSWNVSTGGNAYEVCVGSAPGLCEASGGWVNVGSALQWAVTPALSAATTYWWQVRALGGNTPVQANGGQWWAFTTQADGPGTFGKQTPVRGAGNRSPSGLLLTWGVAVGAQDYEVCLGTQAGLCDVTGGWVNTNGNLNWTVSVALQPATTYWWQVRAVGLGGVRTPADDGEWWHFTTAGSGPQAFGKRAPSNSAAGQGLNPTLSWGESSGASRYEVCVGLLPGECSASGGGWITVNGTSYQASGLNYATTYWWQVRAVNASGQQPADGGTWWQFTTGNADGPLGAFAKGAPVHLATEVATATAALSWTLSAGASRYEVCVGSAPGLCEASDGWVDVGNVTQWTVTPALRAATTYWWQVRARNDAGGLAQADAGQWWAFTTQANGLGAFGKRVPVQGASERPYSGLQLSWAGAFGAGSYEVCLGTQAGLCDVTGSWTPVGNVTVWLVNVALQPATTYWWQVRARDASGRQRQADEGDWWYFTTASGPGPERPAGFGKREPANLATGVATATAVLSWTLSAGASRYEVCVGALAGDCAVTGGWVNAAGTSYALSGLSHATTYWWQVRAVNAGGQTLADGGVWWRFTTLNAPDSPIGAFGKSAPAHEAVGVPTNATLSWNTAANAARYTVCVGTQPGLCDVVNNAETTATNLALAGAQAGRTYWWQVTAHDGAGASRQADEGAWWVFVTANDPVNGPGAFGKQQPVSGTVVVNPFGLQWGVSTNAARYQVCVGRAMGLCDVVNNAIANSGSSWVLPAGSYWWQVMAVDTQGDMTQADGGVWWPFTVESAIGNVDTGGATGTRKEVTPTAVRMGELVSYTIVISNAGSVAVTARVTDTLAVSATLMSATPGYAQTGQTLVWSGVNVPAGGTVVLTVTVRAASGPLPEGYTLFNSMTIGAADGEFTRSAPGVSVEPWRAFVPIVMRPPDLLPRVFMPIVMRP